jgi:hypothetical protein
MEKHESKRKPSGTAHSGELRGRAQQPPDALQGWYGSGGSYGVGGGFDDKDGHDSAPEEPDGRAERTARSEAQQDGDQSAGFERETDPDAAPPKVPDAARTPDEEQLAAKKRRGSRI